MDLVALLPVVRLVDAKTVAAWEYKRPMNENLAEKSRQTQLHRPPPSSAFICIAGSEQRGMATRVDHGCVAPILASIAS